MRRKKHCARDIGELVDQLPRSRQGIKQAAAKHDVESPEAAERRLLKIGLEKSRIADPKDLLKPTRPRQTFGAALHCSHVVPAHRQLEGLATFQAPEFEDTTRSEAPD